jgi:general transcription factor 3C polypeptide 3 (transcription factor C subunit 4)
MAALASGLRPTDSFIMSTLQKHLFREMKLGDAAVKNKDSLKWNPLNRRYAPTSAATNNVGEGDDAVDDDVEDIAGEDVPEETPIDKSSLPPTPTKNNPLTVAIYGQICAAAKSYQSAIC